MLFGLPLFQGSNSSGISASNKNFKYSDLIQLVMKEQKHPKPRSTKLGMTLSERINLIFLGLDLLLKLLHNDPKQRISAEEALHDVYFYSLDSAPPKKLSVDESDSSPQSNKGKSNPSTPKKSPPKSHL